jgi:glycerate dehydrogenase
MSPHKPSCIFLDRDSIDCNDLDLSAIASMTQLVCLDSCTEAGVAKHAADTEIIIVNKVKLTRSHFEQLPALKLICVIATGTNNVDLAAASDHDIVVCNVRDYAAASVSQHVFLLILSLIRHFMEYQHDIKKGLWQAQDQFCLLTYPMQELSGKTLGLIGYGHIARAVEKIALAFDMKVIIAQSLVHSSDSYNRLPLDEVLKNADIISLHCPLSDQTRNLIRQEQFALMKTSAIIINAARGGIINEADLLDALRSGQIAGAGIDCMEHEPPTSNDGLINANLPQLIITPHNAWGTLQARQGLVNGTVKNIKDFLAGQVNSQVNS